MAKIIEVCPRLDYLEIFSLSLWLVDRDVECREIEEMRNTVYENTVMGLNL